MTPKPPPTAQRMPPAAGAAPARAELYARGALPRDRRVRGRHVRQGAGGAQGGGRPGVPTSTTAAHRARRTPAPSTTRSPATSTSRTGRRAPEQFDVIYLDGLHVFEQTLRDLMNALHHLQPHGVIVVDDTRPPTYLASLPDRDKFYQPCATGSASDRQALDGRHLQARLLHRDVLPAPELRTIADNHGQTVVWRTPPRARCRSARCARSPRSTFEQMVVRRTSLRLETRRRSAPSCAPTSGSEA